MDKDDLTGRWLTQDGKIVEVIKFTGYFGLCQDTGRRILIGNDANGLDSDADNLIRRLPDIGHYIIGE